MNPASRGMRNAFRNPTRTFAIVVIIGLSIGLSLTMLVAQKAVDTKIETVKSSVGNTITIAPAGFTPGSSTNNALTTSGLDKLQSIAHVSSISETLTDRQSTTGATAMSFGRPGETSSSSSTTTSLTSPVTPNANRFNAGDTSATSDTAASTFSLPVSFLGTTKPLSADSTALTLKGGKIISGSSDTNNVLISQAMATKNNLAVGSTFTAYNATLTVAGIFSTSNRATENTVILSLPALQRLSGQTGTVTSAVVTVDSLDNLSAATTAVKSSLGSTADVTSSQEQADSTVAPLNSVKSVATFSLIGALVAGAIIILLVMVMIVRERRREIGVVKAIGGSNLRIAAEFMIESVTLAVAGAVIGIVLGIVAGQPVTKLLVNNSTSTATSSQTAGGQMGPGQNGTSSNRQAAPGGLGEGFRRNSTVQGLKNIKTEIGPGLLLEGLGAAVLIAAIGSGLAAVMISKVRPSTVMRTE